MSLLCKQPCSDTVESIYLISFNFYKRFTILNFIGDTPLRNPLISGSKANTLFFRVFLNRYQFHVPKVEIFPSPPKEK